MEETEGTRQTAAWRRFRVWGSVRWEQSVEEKEVMLQKLEEKNSKALQQRHALQI